MTPHPGFERKSFSIPCRNVVPKPMQKPHPPMWMACTNRDTIKVAAQNGLGALAFSFVGPDDPRQFGHAPGIGTPDDLIDHLLKLQAAGMDQVILMQQAGRNRHDHICYALELFAKSVMPTLTKGREEREAKKAAELAPYIEAALARKRWMPEIAERNVPLVRASVKKAVVNQSAG